ncbi:dephospho-CoA kinase [Rhodococcus rhodnii]|uniref:Dephospho-CoA kinase n=2 Tax=Rhodococcus rhodnii TaxID=38312 RepID=R7WTA9_9NOCA|nr:dephospho-CoA kinase [Rhodococcus rhodnii]EOM78516.1 dephospho-CoA kinase [Rhodococcus rhodnii LMG 5362]TXG91310.1 dephospho-CoA kinase [Rhodococcus rhodnii]
MLRIGLTGGIGSGKSTVANALAARGAVVVDADRIAREVVEPGTPGLAALVERFGSEILDDEGALDRPALARIAFADDDSRTALNGIVHPLVGARTQELVDAAGPDDVVVQDIPLLVEGGMAPAFALVVVVWTPEAERLRRLVALRGMDEADARNRIAAQASDEQRRAVADVWLDNSGAPGALDDTIAELWTERLVPFARNLRDGVVARSLPVLVAADPAWPDQARRVIARLALACGDAAVRIDHIGSTAVPGVPAKDVIDVQITVRDLAAADALAIPLAEIGFPRRDDIDRDDPKPAYQGGETDPALWAKRFHGSADPGRPVNVHLRVDGWPNQEFALLIRDWLRSDESARDEYVAVKERAAAAAADLADHTEAITAYLDVKTPWFDLAYHRAWEWAAETGWTAAAAPE